MGQSTNGLIAFGMKFEEGEHPDWFDYDEENEMDFENHVAKAYGLEQPEWDEENQQPYFDYLDKKRELLDEIGVDIENYCSGDYPMYMLVIKDSVKKANRGYPTNIGHISLEVNNDWVNKLGAFCRGMGVEFDIKQFDWWLFSYWG